MARAEQRGTSSSSCSRKHRKRKTIFCLILCTVFLTLSLSQTLCRIQLLIIHPSEWIPLSQPASQPAWIDDPTEGRNSWTLFRTKRDVGCFSSTRFVKELFWLDFLALFCLFWLSFKLDLIVTFVQRFCVFFCSNRSSRAAANTSNGHHPIWINWKIWKMCFGIAKQSWVWCVHVIISQAAAAAAAINNLDNLFIENSSRISALSLSSVAIWAQI